MAIIHTAVIENNKIKVEIYDEKKTIDRICNNNRLGLFMAETCARYMNPYVPMDTGMLSQNYITEPYKVTYTSVYAKKMFYGEGFNFSKEKHPLATARWDKACEQAKRNQIAREVTAFLERGY